MGRIPSSRFHFSQLGCCCDTKTWLNSSIKDSEVAPARSKIFCTDQPQDRQFFGGELLSSRMAYLSHPLSSSKRCKILTQFLFYYFAFFRRCMLRNQDLCCLETLMKGKLIGKMTISALETSFETRLVAKFEMHFFFLYMDKPTRF